MKKKLISTLAMALSTVMLLSACGGSKQAASSSAANDAVSSTNKAVVTTTGGGTQATSTTDKDTLVFGINAEPSSLEPGASSASDSYPKMLMIQIYDTLVREPIGDRTKLEGLIAESWEVAEDGMYIDFKIKQGVKFHNGDEMTVDDVAFSINRSLSMPNVKETSDMIKDAEVIDENTVRVNMNYAYAPVLYVLENPCFSIQSKAYVEKCEADGTNLGRNPMGTGAYKFVSWQNGANIKLEANEDWFNGAPDIKNVEFRIMVDATTGAIALEAGDLDLYYGTDSADMPRLRENPDVNVLSVQSSGFYFIGLNTENEALSDVRVRKAINMAINRQEIIDGGQDGIGWVTECPITPGIFGYQEDFHADAQDIEAAKALLADAGYADGLTIEMKTPENSYYARPAQVIQEQLRQIGITVDLKTMERGAFNTDVGNRDYDSIYFWIGAPFPDADTIVYKLFCSEFAHSGIATNTALVNDPTIEGLVKEARAEQDSDKRMELYRQVSELNNENAWYIPILTSTNSITARTYVNNCYGHSASLYYVSDWSFAR